MRKTKKANIAKGAILTTPSGTLTVEDICDDGDVWCSWGEGEKQYGAFKPETLHNLAKWWTQRCYDANNFKGGMNHDPVI